MLYLAIKVNFKCKTKYKNEMLHDPTNDESIITYLVSEIKDEKVEMSVELQKCINNNHQYPVQ